MHEEQMNSKPKRHPAFANSITIVGFLMFLTGVILFSVGIIDVLVHIDSLKTALMLVGGIACYKVGHMMIRHCATLRARPERRRHLLSDNG